MEKNIVLHTKWLGKEILSYTELSSTNTEAKKLAEAGALHGTVVRAQSQTAGRGRRGRQWLSDPGMGIWCSFILKPVMESGDASMLTLVAAMAVRKAIEQVTGISPGIKWPNDVVISGRKVCGILTELNAVKGKVNYIIVGIGINVKAREFPKELKEIATSLENERKASVSMEVLFYKLLEHFEHYYELFMETKDLGYLQEEYQQYLVNKDRQVKVMDVKDAYEGIARGINEKGELLVDRDGELVKVNAGEVSVRGIYGYV